MNKHIFFKTIFLSVITLLLSAGISSAQQPQTKVTLGIKPDYMYTFKGKGVRVTDVIDGQPAKQAGIQAGDIITSFNGVEIKDIFAYKDELSKYKDGDKVKVTVQRDGKSLSLPVTFK